MPPVLDVPFLELPGGGPQEMLAHDIGPGHRQGQDVLELVAETVCPTGLVERGTGPDPARERLVHEPAVEHHIHGAIWSLHLHRPQQAIPMLPNLPENLIAAHRAITRDQGSGLLTALPLPQ